eukprot:scaffold2609_cov24-Tisochrysis_lutea.AAC.3
MDTLSSSRAPPVGTLFERYYRETEGRAGMSKEVQLLLTALLPTHKNRGKVCKKVGQSPTLRA